MVRWRCAGPRVGWWRTAQRQRLPLPPRSHSQRKRDERLKRPAWVRSHAWSRVTSGVGLSVLGAVQDGTTKVFSKIVPHFDAQAWRPYIHHGRATCGTTDTEVGLVVERRGMPRAPQLASPLEHGHGRCRCHRLPAPCGHHLNPIEGCWRVLKDAIGAGRCFAPLHLF
jgi:DDE superfamily endonuclease